MKGMRRLGRFVPVLGVVLIFLTSCSGTIGGNSSSTTVSPQTDPSTAPSSSTTTNGTSGTTTDSSDSPTTTDSLDSSTTSLLGGPIDFGPQSGDVLAVVGVSHDDKLNLRAGPGPSQQVLATIDPTYATLVAHGETWDTSQAFWISVDYEGTSGWVHFGFVAYLGYTDDVTDSVVTDLGEYPVADTMEELGLLVAEVFESVDPPSRVVMTVGATPGDLGEVTYDVIGLGDDAEYGVRLHIFGEATADGFTLKTVEMTSLCGRGTSAEKLCV